MSSSFIYKYFYINRELNWSYYRNQSIFIKEIFDLFDFIIMLNLKKDKKYN